MPLSNYSKFLITDHPLIFTDHQKLSSYHLLPMAKFKQISHFLIGPQGIEEALVSHFTFMVLDIVVSLKSMMMPSSRTEPFRIILGSWHHSSQLNLVIGAGVAMWPWIFQVFWLLSFWTLLITLKHLYLRLMLQGILILLRGEIV